MFGIPDNFPFHKLVGATLIQVCTGEHQLQLHFDGMQSISIESSLRINDGEDKIENFVEVSTSVCRLLGDKVLGANAPDKRTLRIIFAKGVLEILDDSDQYEAFQVGFPDEGLFVI